MSVAKRLEAVRQRIAAAARAAGRDPASVRLVAVSKRKSPELIRQAYGAGQRDFGENYVQELVDKADAAELADLPDLRWHFIGHLQRNKAKHAVRVASCLHAVDSVRLVGELGKRAGEVPPAKRVFGDDARLPVFVEVNVGGEAQKSGCAPGELPAVLDAISAHTNLRAVGLMTVPPFTDEPTEARPYFDQLASLRETHGGEQRLPELSMGMTADLEHAIAAGATVVRIGTAIFGPREAA